MAEKENKKITLIINRSPYGDEYAFNAIRLATALLHERVKLNIFLLGEGVYVAVKNQKPPKGATNIEEMLKKFILNRAEIRVCGLCVRSRGLEDNLIEGCSIGSMSQLGEWVAGSDQTLNF
jgi:sulfur relay (sulfurtransferase) complex TusBCD TusD component (DsrE family)